jgi:hypothetical protein
MTTTARYKGHLFVAYRLQTTFVRVHIFRSCSVKTGFHLSWGKCYTRLVSDLN